MKRIKIKVKYLICVILIALIAAVYTVPKSILSSAEAMEKTDIEKAKILYKRYISLVPYSKKKPEILFKIAENIYPTCDFEIRSRIYPNCWSGGNVVDYSMAKNAEKYYLEIINNYRDSKYTANAFSNLMQIYTEAGWLDKGEELIDRGVRDNNLNAYKEAYTYKMIYGIINRKYNEVIDIGKEYIEKHGENFDINILIGEAYLYSKDYKKAEEYYNKSKVFMNGADYRKGDNIIADVYGINSWGRLMYLEGLNEWYGNGKVTGRITVNGKPVPFAFMYLKKASDNSYHSPDYGEELFAVTDLNGEYEIENIKKGDYSVGTAIPSIQLPNTVYKGGDIVHLGENETEVFDINFVEPMELHGTNGRMNLKGDSFNISWSEVPGASYYFVYATSYMDPLKGNGIGSSYSTSISDKINGTSCTVDIGKVNRDVRSWGSDGDGMMNPQVYIGIFYPGAEVPIYVEAFNKSGRKISSSQPFIINYADMNVVKVSENKLTDGHKLILQGKIKEAGEFFEAELKKQPDNINYLQILYRIYLNGERRKYDVKKGKDIIIGGDMKKANETAERLYKITNDYFYRKLPLKDYSLLDDNEIIEGYKKIPEDKLDIDDYYNISNANINIKSFKEADKLFDIIYNKVDVVTAYKIRPIILKIYFGEYEKALEYLKSGKLTLDNADSKNIQGLIKELLSDKPTDEEKNKFNNAIEVILSEKSQEAREAQASIIYPKIKDLRLRGILDEFFKEESISIK